MNLSAEDEQKALAAAEAASDDVARAATWWCLRCDFAFPGEELFTGELPAPGRIHRRHFCPNYGKYRLD